MKYIIDLPEEFAEATKEYWDKTVGMQLEPYDEPDRKAIEDEVWELVRRIICPSDCCVNSISAHTKEIFNKEGWEIRGIFNNLSYQEAKSKYEARKKQKNEIHIGDEVENASHKKGIVLKHSISPINDLKYVRVLYTDDNGNSFISVWEKNDVCKTGRHFPEVVELLEKMKEN